MWIFDQDKRQDRRDVADLKELLTTQLAALGERRYELTLRTRDDQVSYAHVSPADILDRVRDLRAVNLAGTDIALRPAARSGLVLLRDVPAAQVADLTQDGFPPVLLTEPAPARFDAWVRVDSVGIQRGLHDSMAQVLAARYDLDTRTAGAEQAAALAGFTTRADPDRRIPLVSADRESRVAPAALDLADWVLEHAQLDPALVDDQRGRWVPPDQRNEAARAAAARLDQVLGDRDPAERAPAPAPDRFTHPTPAHYMVAVYADLHADQRVAHEVAGRQDAATRDQAASAAARVAAGQFHARFPYQQPDTFAAVLRANGVEDATIAAAVRAGFGDPPRGPDQAALRAELAARCARRGCPSRRTWPSRSIRTPPRRRRRRRNRPTPRSSGRCAGRSSRAATAGSTSGRPSGARPISSSIRTRSSRGTSWWARSTRAGRRARGRAARRPSGRPTSRGRRRRCWRPRTRHRDRRDRSANGRGGRTVHNGHAAATATAANQRSLSAGAQHDE